MIPFIQCPNFATNFLTIQEDELNYYFLQLIDEDFTKCHSNNYNGTHNLPRVWENLT